MSFLVKCKPRRRDESRRRNVDAPLMTFTKGLMSRDAKPTEKRGAMPQNQP